MTLEQELVKKLKLKKLTVTVAESCTGGLVAKRITDIPGSSEVFECGIVSYSNRIKTELLGVKPQTLKEFGAVSEQTAREMAEGVLKLAKADLAVAVTGIAGPCSDDTEKPVGLVYIAVSDGKNVAVKKLLSSFENDIRMQNRDKSADMALKMLLELI